MSQIFGLINGDVGKFDAVKVEILGKASQPKSCSRFVFIKPSGESGRIVTIEEFEEIRKKSKKLPRTEICDINGSWVRIPKCFKVGCSNLSEGIFMETDAKILAGNKHICEACSKITKGRYRRFDEASLR